jgi:hypothetical protein
VTLVTLITGLLVVVPQVPLVFYANVHGLNNVAEPVKHAALGRTIPVRLTNPVVRSQHAATAKTAAQQRLQHPPLRLPRLLPRPLLRLLRLRPLSLLRLLLRRLRLRLVLCVVVVRVVPVLVVMASVVAGGVVLPNLTGRYVLWSVLAIVSGILIRFLR